METTVVKEFDELGRILLPSKIRELYGIATGDNVGIVLTDNAIIVSKAEKAYDKVKTVDELGRIVIPKDMRAKFGNKVKIVAKADEIHLCCVD